MDTPDEDRNELEMLFEIEENEQETKRIKLEETVISATKDRDRLSVELRSPGADRRATTTPLLALGNSGEMVRTKESSIESPVKLPPLEKKNEHQQQPQRIENVATLDDSGMASNPAAMKLHRIESAVIG